jgi:type IV pilus assembly protein PilX
VSAKENIDMNARMNFRSRQTGATLIVGLILLLVLTVVGVSGMNTATMELTMAGNTQFQNDAFQAAEDGIDTVLATRDFTTAAPTTLPFTGVPDYDRQAKTRFVVATPVPDAAFSMGVSTGSVQAFHFEIVAVGKASRNASSTHTQDFYQIGPGGP